MSKYLVTGAAGFIGSALAKHLVAKGHEVVTVDNLSTGYAKAIPEGVTFIQGDCQADSVMEALRTHTFDAVYHIAGQSSGEVSFEDPVYDLQTNTQSTLQLLDLCRTIGCSKFIYASSMAVYGSVPDRPIDEQEPAHPKSFYAVGKLASEHYMRIYSEQFGIATAALRLFNVYGPGQNLTNMKQGMVSIFLAQALRDQHIHVKGAADRFRDFVYIDDIVRAFVDTERALASGAHLLLNVCSGQKTRVDELVDAIVQNMDFPISTRYEGSTPGDQFGIYGNGDQARELIQWQPSTEFQAGIRAMADWAKNKQL